MDFFLHEFCGQSHSSWAWCEKQPVTWHDHQVIQRLQRKLYPPQSGNKIAQSVIGLKTLPWRLRLRLHPTTAPFPSSFLSSLFSDRSSIFSFILSLYFDPRAWPNRMHIKRRERKKHPALPISRSNYYWSNYYWSQNLRQCPQGFKKLIYHKRKKKDLKIVEQNNCPGWVKCWGDGLLTFLSLKIDMGSNDHPRNTSCSERLL